MACMWDNTRGWVACREMPKHFQRGSDTLITPPSRLAALGRVELGLVGLPGKALTRDATKRLRVIVHAAEFTEKRVLN